MTGSGRTGATISLAFTGRSIAFVGPVGPRRGKARIYIDGTYVTTITMRRATVAARQVAYARAFAGSGSHTITVRVDGSGKHPGVRLDAFIVGR